MGGGSPLELRFHHLALVTELEVGVGGEWGAMWTRMMQEGGGFHRLNPQGLGLGEGAPCEQGGKVTSPHTSSLAPGLHCAAVSMRQLGIPVVILLG